jgi:hypothetical protein
MPLGDIFHPRQRLTGGTAYAGVGERGGGGEVKRLIGTFSNPMAIIRPDGACEHGAELVIVSEKIGYMFDGSNVVPDVKAVDIRLFMTSNGARLLAVTLTDMADALDVTDFTKRTATPPTAAEES